MRHVSQNETILAGFLPWVETQSGWYDYGDCRGCAFASYLQALGHWDASCDYLGFSLRTGGTEYEMPKFVDAAVLAHPRTYEALAERLRAIADADRKMADANRELERGSA